MLYVNVFDSDELVVTIRSIFTVVFSVQIRIEIQLIQVYTT